MESNEHFPGSVLFDLPATSNIFDHLLQEILFSINFHVKCLSSLSYNFAILALFVG